MNASLFGRPIPQDMEALICDQLDPKSLKDLALITNYANVFVNNKYPVLSLVRNPDPQREAKLSPLQKLELQFIRFNDRPRWQRIIIVAGLILVSPVICLYHSPKMIKAVYLNVLTPVAQKISSVALWIYTKILKPIGLAADTHLLQPTIKIIKQVAHAVFVTMPNLALKYVLKPLYDTISAVASFVERTILTPLVDGTVKTCQFIHTRVLTPIGESIKKIAQLSFNALSSLYKTVSKYFGGGLKRLAIFTFHRIIVPLARFTWNWILCPTGRVLYAVAKFFCFTVLPKIIDYMIVPLFNRVILPFLRIVRVILKGICVTFPLKIYNSIFLPVALKIASIVNNLLVQPFRRLMSLVGSFVVQKVKEVASLIFQSLIIPAKNMLTLSGYFIYNQILMPTGILIVGLPSLFRNILSSFN